MSNKTKKIKKNIAQRDFVHFPDELLWQESTPVTNFETDALYAMIRKMRLANSREKGLGVSAIQVGYTKRAFYYAIPDIGEGVMINPEIVVYGPEMATMREGCLSIRGYYWEITRPAEVTVQWQDQMGSEYVNTVGGITARLIQHEIDHMNGLLISDYLNDDDYAKFDDDFFGKGLRGNMGAMFIDHEAS